MVEVIEHRSEGALEVGREEVFPAHAQVCCEAVEEGTRRVAHVPREKRLLERAWQSVAVRVKKHARTRTHSPMNERRASEGLPPLPLRRLARRRPPSSLAVSDAPSSSCPSASMTLALAYSRERVRTSGECVAVGLELKVSASSSTTALIDRRRAGRLRESIALKVGRK